MFWYVSNEQDQVAMKKSLLENIAILPWETAGCMLGVSEAHAPRPH